MKRLSVFITLFVLATACGGKDKNSKPERLLSEQEMVTIMTDVQIIEADINYQKMQERERDPNDTTEVVPKDYLKMSREYYDQLFEHYGITDSILEQNMTYVFRAGARRAVAVRRSVFLTFAALAARAGAA